MKRPIIALLLLLSITTASFAGDVFEAMNIDTPREKMIAPPFELNTLDGRKVMLSDFKGRVVLLNFWATWCTPCRAEMPGMETLWQKYKGKGFTVIGINIERGGKEVVKKFVKDFKLTFPILLSPSAELRNLYEVRGLPTSYIIGRDGEFLGKAVGGREWDSPESYKLIQTVLNRAGKNEPLLSQAGLLGEKNESRNREKTE